MSTTQPLLNPKGLLAAMVAVLLSGNAIAETAGRVNFIVGEVAAINIADGSRRVLSKGDLVNSGERLETGKGRLQIRFTDGSFVSLQPNTVFGLDNYTFAKNKPEEGSLLFNFVRGGMRTVSGAIGKVNRANYKVKTPVATIGIRGTGYAGNMNNGVLVVSVSKGTVNLSNDFGSSNVPAGQTFRTQEGKAPEPAPSGVTAQARADSPDKQSDEQEENRNNSSDDNASDAASIAAIDKLQQQIEEKIDDGIPPVNPEPELGPLFPNSTLTTVNGDIQISPFYAIAHTKARADGSLRGSFNSSQLGVQFKDSKDSERNAVTLVEEVNFVGTVAAVTGEKNTVFSVGTLKTVNITTLGALSFGEWTNGTGTFDGATLTLGSDKFLGYIVGLQATDVIENQKVTFSLDKASLVRSSTSTATGTLDSLVLGVNYAQGLLDINMRVKFGNDTYVIAKGNIHRFQIDNSGGTQLDELLAQGPNCAQAGCPTSLSVLFAGLEVNGKNFGTQAGVAYIIELLNSTLSGVGALGASNLETITQTNPTNQVDGSKETIYTASFVSNSSELPLITDTTTGKFDPITGELLVAVSDTATYGRADVDSAAITLNAGSYKKVLAWGQWHNGTIAHPAFPNGVNLPATIDLHYIIGQTTSAADMAAASLAKTNVVYTFEGGTSQVLLNGVSSAVNQTGFLNANFGTASATLDMNFTGFDSNKAGLSGLAVIGSTTFVNQDRTLSPNLNFNNMAVTATGANGTLACISCTGTASGSFAGGLDAVTKAPIAVGLGYQVTGTAAVTAGVETVFSISGTQALAKPVSPL